MNRIPLHTGPPACKPSYSGEHEWESLLRCKRCGYLLPGHTTVIVQPRPCPACAQQRRLGLGYWILLAGVGLQLVGWWFSNPAAYLVSLVAFGASILTARDRVVS